MVETLGQIAAWVFWTAAGLLVYTYVGYPTLVRAAARAFPREHCVADIEPSVSLLIPARNEAEVIGAKVRNALSLDYPREKLQIRVISDGSDDGTDEIVGEYLSAGVELQRVEEWGGKPNALNVAVPQATGEILVLCDANTMFDVAAIRSLVRHFVDGAVGAVTGNVLLRCSEVSYGQGESLFYRMERNLAAHESAVWTALGVDGGMYALRQALYVPNRPDTLADDFALAMNIARTGARILYDPEAKAYEDAVESPAQEFRRRARTVAGGFQALFEGLGRPRWNQPLLWLAYLSHKVLRWFGPFLLILALTGNVLAVCLLDPRRPSWLIYCTLLALQGLLYLLALAGVLMGRRRMPSVVSCPYCFCLANAAALAGFLTWLSGRQSVRWCHADRGQPVDPMSR